jgi:hypothetical protein
MRQAAEMPRKTNIDSMNKKQTLVTVAGAALLAGSQAQAQFNYANGDLVLNFRDPSNPTTVADVSINLGSISTFSALTGTTVLDNGVNNGYTPVFTEAELASAFSGSTTIGFSAAATTSANDTSWITRSISAGTLTPPSPPSGPLESGSVNTLTASLLNIGDGAVGIGGTTFTSLDASGAIVQVGSSQQLSYQGSATQPSTPTQVDYNGAENVSVANGGALESTSTSGSTVYSALWEVPVSTSLKAGKTAADTYLGYFTFNGTSDELDFTSVNSVPEPSTFALLEVTGLLALGLRYRFNSRKS